MAEVLGVILVLCMVYGLVFMREPLKLVMRKKFEGICGYRAADLNRGIYELEFPELQEELKAFFSAISVPVGYVDAEGWQNITFRICLGKGDTPEELKAILAIKIRDFIVLRRGVENNGIYFPVFSGDTLVVRIACSPKAAEEFRKLNFQKPSEMRNASIKEAVEPWNEN